MICKWCGVELKFSEKWVHPGGGLYVVYCKKCGWQSDRLEDQRRICCPECGGEVRDHHCVLPVPTSEVCHKERDENQNSPRNCRTHCKEIS